MEKQELIEKSKQHADENGFLLNPDSRLVDALVTGLLKNEEKHGPGKRYCPCRPVTGNDEQDKNIICPCIYHRDELKRDGKCHCGLFVRG
jgi:ferredoxin-thioredoxin reductase catalytic subunit